VLADWVCLPLEGAIFNKNQNK